MAANALLPALAVAAILLAYGNVLAYLTIPAALNSYTDLGC